MAERGANWVHTEHKDTKTRAEKSLVKLKKARKGKNLTLVKVCDHPLTYKEIEVHS